MERVAFLIEDTGERLTCLLNPNTVVMRRVAGVRPRRSASGELAGASLADTPLLFTGGGSTELEMDLLFDVNVADSRNRTDDVRTLTRPFWELAENVAEGARARGGAGLRMVRLVWGKSWDVPGVVAAVAERVEYFTDGGAPQRSWMRLRLLRVSARGRAAATPSGTVPGEGLSAALASATSGGPGPLGPDALEALRNQPPESGHTHALLGADSAATSAAGGEGGRTTQRLDEISYRYYQRPDLWRIIASVNDVDDPLHMKPGTVLRVPRL